MIIYLIPQVVRISNEAIFVFLRLFFIISGEFVVVCIFIIFV